jgi:hypothetical protein
VYAEITAEGSTAVVKNLAIYPADSEGAINGQNAVTDFVPLSGRTIAVYTAQVGGLAYYRHSDWLGSSRLASTPSRTVYYDGAYGPFGEPYAQSGATDSRLRPP